jgi:hypothetical protein
MIPAEYLIIATGIATYILGIYQTRSEIKSKEYRCPYCNKFHRIMPIRESEY